MIYQAMTEGAVALSSYAEGLPDKAKSHYLDRISVISGIDPFCGTFGEQMDHFPSVDTCDLLSYLVLITSYSSLERGRDWRHTTSLCLDG